MMKITNAPILYTVFPCRDACLCPGDMLILDHPNPFPDTEQMVLLRHFGAFSWCGYVRGEEAVVLRQSPVRRLRVQVVADNGSAQAVIVE